MAIEELRGKSWDEISGLGAEAGQYIAEHGDVILFKGKTKGETAKAVAQLARGLAVLAYQPGGVTFMGEHWEARRGVA